MRIEGIRDNTPTLTERQLEELVEMVRRPQIHEGHNRPALFRCRLCGETGETVGEIAHNPIECFKGLKNIGQDEEEG